MELITLNMQVIIYVISSNLIFAIIDRQMIMKDPFDIFHLLLMHYFFVNVTNKNIWKKTLRCWLTMVISLEFKQTVVIVFFKVQHFIKKKNQVTHGQKWILFLDFHTTFSFRSIPYISTIVYPFTCALKNQIIC